MAEYCGVCRFFRYSENKQWGEGLLGECRRKPPVLNAEFADREYREHVATDHEGPDKETRKAPQWVGLQGFWPSVYDFEWCGEFKSKQGGGE